MPTALYRLFFAFALALLLPMAAQAGDAEDFVAANPNQQAALLEAWAAHPEPARIELIDALHSGQLTLNALVAILNFVLSEAIDFQCRL